MTLQNGKITWAPKVAKAKIQRLYQDDARGILNEDEVDAVGWALWSRCDSILSVTAAHYGRLRCPLCAAQITQAASADTMASAWAEEDTLLCPACGWQMTWKTFHQSYKGKQLFGANAVEHFETFHRAFPRAREVSAKMLLIDQLIHAFHSGLKELGRPAAANLIEGNLKEVIQFLDALSAGPGFSASREEWRRNLESVSWSWRFLPPEPGNSGPSSPGE